jgi:hypothetical protein
VRLERTASVSSNAVQNLISRSGPDEGLGIFVVYVDELANRRFQFPDAAECAAPNSFVTEFGEPSLDQLRHQTFKRFERYSSLRKLTPLDNS